MESKADSKELVSESLNGIRPDLVTSGTHKNILPCLDKPYATDQEVVSIEIPSGIKIKRDESTNKDASEDLVSSRDFKDTPEENNCKKYTSDDDDASNMSSREETLIETFDLETYLKYITELSNKVQIKSDIERETLTKLLEVIKSSLEKYSTNDNIVNTPKHIVSGTSLQRSSELSFKECSIRKDSISEMENILHKRGDINESRNSVSHQKDSLEGNLHNTQLENEVSELTSLKSNIEDDVKQTIGGAVSVGKTSGFANNVTSNQKSISSENILEDKCTPGNIKSQNDNSDQQPQDISYENIPEKSNQETNMENASTETSASTVTRTEDLKTSSEDAYHSANQKLKEVQHKLDGIQEFKHLIEEGNGIKNIEAEESYMQIEFTDGELIDNDEESISFDLKQDDGNDELDEYIQQFYSDYADNETDPAVTEYVQNRMKNPIHHKYESTCTEAHGNSSESIPTTFKTHSKSKQRCKQKKLKTSSAPKEDNVSENISACRSKETEDSYFHRSKENSEASNESINISAESNFSNKQNNGFNNRSGIENVLQSEQDVVPRVTDKAAHGTSFNDMKLVPVCESNDTKRDSFQFHLQPPNDLKLNEKQFAIKVTDEPAVPLDDHELETKNSTTDVPGREYSERSVENISKGVFLSNTSQTDCRTTQEGDLDATALKAREILRECAMEIQTLEQQVEQSVKQSVKNLNREYISEEIKRNKQPLQTRIDDLIAQRLKEDKEYSQNVAELMGSESTWEFINRKKNRKTIYDSDEKHREISNNKINLEKSRQETNITKASKKTSGPAVSRAEDIKKTSKSACRSTFRKPKEVQRNVDEYQVLKDLSKQSNGIIPIKDVRENYIRIVGVNKDNEESISFDTSDNNEYQKLDDYRQQFYSDYADSETDVALTEYVKIRIKNPIQHPYEPKCTEAHGDSSEETLSATSKTHAKSKKRHKQKKPKSSACNEDNIAENVSTSCFKETDESYFSHTNRNSEPLNLSIKDVSTECKFSNIPSKPNDVLNSRYGTGDALLPRQDVVSAVADDTAQETSFINSRFEPVSNEMKNLVKETINSAENAIRLYEDLIVEGKELKSLENIGEGGGNETKSLGKKENIQLPEPVEHISEDKFTSNSSQTDSKITRYIKHSTESGVVLKSNISKEQEGDSNATILKDHETLRESAMVIQILGQKIAQSVKRSVKDLNREYISEEIKRNQQPLQLKIDNLIAQRLKDEEEYLQDAGISMDYETADAHDEPRWKFVNRKIYRKRKNSADD